MEAATYESTTTGEAPRVALQPAASLTLFDRDPQQPTLMYLSHVDAGGKHRRFRHPLKVEIEPGSDGVVVFAPAVSIGGAGRDAAAAIADLSDTLWALWLELGPTPEEQLHESARTLVRRLRYLLPE